MSHFDLARPHRMASIDSQRSRYAAPSLPHRALAFGIDAGGFLLAAPFVLGLCAVALRDYWALGAIGLIAGYAVASFTLCGQTMGMALANIQLVDERSGRCPSLPQVVMRTALTVPPLVGGAAIMNEALTPGSRALPETWLLLAAAAALVGIISALWGLVDSGRMLHDRLCGVITVHSRSFPTVNREPRR